MICDLGAKVSILDGHTDVHRVLTSVCEKGCPSWMDTMPWAGMAYDLSARVSILDGQTKARYAQCSDQIVSKDVHPGWTTVLPAGMAYDLTTRVSILDRHTDGGCVLASVCQHGCPSWMDTVPWVEMAC